MAVQVVILAAGQGKRMHSSQPKVLHSLAGKSLIEHVLQAAKPLSSLPPMVIHGHQGPILQQNLAQYAIRWIEQKEQLGTGHAVLQTLSYLADQDHVLVLYGDVPLISTTMLQNLINDTPANALGMMTAQFENPKGYGRIKRDEQGKISRIIEEKDATEQEKKITEINSGIYFIPVNLLKTWLPKIKNQNAQNEYYLTDLIACAVKENTLIYAAKPREQEEIMGVNDRAELARLERFYQKKIAQKLMQKGVTLLDPMRFDVRGQVTVGRDVTIDVNVILEGDVTIGDDCIIGPHTLLRNVVLGNRVEVRAHSILDGAEIGSDAVIGPFARLRPGALLANETHVGNFVEIKNSVIGEKTKVNHLSYIGDSEIGKQVNIGAGTITCNYDGVNKHKTTIGDRVMVGSDTTLIAPIIIHDDVYIATATTVRKDVPAGALVFNSREEKIRQGWTFARKEKNHIREK